MQIIKNKEAISAADAAYKRKCMTGEQMMEDQCNIAGEQKILLSNKWRQNMAICYSKALIIMDLGTTVAQKIKNDDDGLLNMHTD